jgi:hypothetical protein
MRELCGAKQKRSKAVGYDSARWRRKASKGLANAYGSSRKRQASAHRKRLQRSSEALFSSYQSHCAKVPPKTSDPDPEEFGRSASPFAYMGAHRMRKEEVKAARVSSLISLRVPPSTKKIEAQDIGSAFAARALFAGVLITRCGWRCPALR